MHTTSSPRRRWTIRVHGEDLKILPRERLAKALRRILDRPSLADVIIPDLARWEDWSAIDRVVELFESATEETSLLKPAAVGYLVACPLPSGAKALDRLRAIDPTAVQRAETSMKLFGVASAPAPPPDEPDIATPRMMKLGEPDVAEDRSED